MRQLLAATLLSIAVLSIAAAPKSAANDTTHYTVQAGDYLVLIGLKFGVLWQNIAEENQVVAPYTIYPGQTLTIPPPKCENPDSEGTQYIVKAGDYLFIIGQHFGVDWQEIAEANCLNAPYLIYPGQVLIVPQEQEEDED